MILEENWSNFARTVYEQKYQHPGETWKDTAYRVASEVMQPIFPDKVDAVAELIAQRKFMPGGRYLYAAGRPLHQVQNCLLLDVEDSRESIADLNRRVTSGLMTGAGIGIVWSKLRSRGSLVRGSGGTSTGPTAFMQAVNEIGRGIMQGGARRSAIWAGLHWNHPDVFEFMSLKDWPDYLVEAKLKDFNAAAPMDMTNISVILDDAFFTAYENDNDSMHEWARKVYDTAIDKMLRTGEPGFSIDVGENAGEHLRNACTEVTSRDDNDICNLGSLVLPRFDSIEEYGEAVELATYFLLAGTIYSDVPYEEVAKTREKNRRLGLGNMGFAEWLHVRNKPYAPDDELGEWLSVYRDANDKAMVAAAAEAGVSTPVKGRAIAPTGTIGILAETTTGLEPVFAAAIKRRYLKGTEWHFQYVVDASAKRILEAGATVELLDQNDALGLAQDPARRLDFQTFVQKYVDHGISSTLNLPAFSEQSFSPQDFGSILYERLPHLRGVTVYPDGARGGQPLTKADLETALQFEGYEYAEVGNDMACGPDGVCGI